MEPSSTPIEAAGRPDWKQNACEECTRSLGHAGATRRAHGYGQCRVGLAAHLQAAWLRGLRIDCTGVIQLHQEERETLGDRNGRRKCWLRLDHQASMASEAEKVEIHEADHEDPRKDYEEKVGSGAVYELLRRCY